MPLDAPTIEDLIREALPDAEIEIQDLAGDGDHYAARVTSSQFEGLSRVKQHRWSIMHSKAASVASCTHWQSRPPSLPLKRNFFLYFFLPDILFMSTKTLHNIFMK